MMRDTYNILLCQRRLRPLLLGVALVLGMLPAGCFSERAFPLDENALDHVSAADLSPDGRRLPAAQWATAAQNRLAHLLPADGRRSLTSAELAPCPARAAPVDVYQFFGVNRATTDAFFCNLDGMIATAQITPPVPPADAPLPLWPGFADVRVPVADDIQLFARLAGPSGPDLGGSYIILTHGLFGSLDGLDALNQAEALRAAGHHVLALELRGHGRNLNRFPDRPMGFGTFEARDLIVAAQWLRQAHEARRVGLVSFSISGFDALLAAWIDGRTPGPADAASPILASQPAPPATPAFDAGIVIVSPPADIIELADRFDRPWGLLDGACKASFQKHVAERLRSDHGPASFRMWDFVDFELRRAGWPARYHDEAAYRADLLRFVNFAADSWQVGAARMSCVRSPLLVLHAANDPLGTAQGVSELFGRVSNPNCGVILLPQGGHMGFVAHAPAYYYSLLRAFFNPATGPRAAARPQS